MASRYPLIPDPPVREAAPPRALRYPAVVGAEAVLVEANEETTGSAGAAGVTGAAGAAGATDDDDPMEEAKEVMPDPVGAGDLGRASR